MISEVEITRSVILRAMELFCHPLYGIGNEIGISPLDVYVCLCSSDRVYYGAIDGGSIALYYIRPRITIENNVKNVIQKQQKGIDDN